jgi:hypothetical protein
LCISDLEAQPLAVQDEACTGFAHDASERRQVGKRVLYSVTEMSAMRGKARFYMHQMERSRFDPFIWGSSTWRSCAPFI